MITDLDQVIRVWPMIERLVQEARDGRWHSSATCDQIIARYLGMADPHPKIGAIMDALEDDQ